MWKPRLESPFSLITLWSYRLFWSTDRTLALKYLLCWQETGTHFCEQLLPLTPCTLLLSCNPVNFTPYIWAKSSTRACSFLTMQGQSNQGSSNTNEQSNNSYELNPCRLLRDWEVEVWGRERSSWEEKGRQPFPWKRPGLSQASHSLSLDATHRHMNGARQHLALTLLFARGFQKKRRKCSG